MVPESRRKVTWDGWWWRDKREGLPRGKQLLGVIDRFIILVGRAGFKCIYMCQNIKLCNLNRFCLSHVDYTSIKLFKKSDTTVVQSQPVYTALLPHFFLLTARVTASLPFGSDQVCNCPCTLNAYHAPGTVCYMRCGIFNLTLTIAL